MKKIVMVVTYYYGGINIDAELVSKILLAY